jgi:glycerol kinase
MLPRVVDTSGVFGEASALPGAPPLASLVGDQQGSLVGQSCVRPGMAKVTFGTGGMLDLCTGGDAPATAQRSAHGTFPIVAWSRGGTLTWGTEAIMLSAGTNVEWLVSDLGIVSSPAATHEVAAGCDTTDGVVYVPALMGLGTPHWDYGARGTLLGLTRGSGRAQVVRAVLEGVAHRGADLLEAAERDSGISVPSLRIDGGMSQNPTFVQALANATGRTVEVSRHTEATTMGAAYLAGLAVGVWDSLDDIASAWQPREVVEPTGALDREQWARAVERARGWIPDLSALDF